MDVMDKIRQVITEHPVVIFMKGTPDFPQCGFSSRAVQALKACDAEFAYVNIYEDEEIYRALPQFANWPTFPQIYISGELIGGCDITLDLFKSGELRRMIEEATSKQGDNGNSEADAA